MGRYTSGPTAFERACSAASQLVAVLALVAVVALAAAGCLAALDLLGRVAFGG